MAQLYDELLRLSESKHLPTAKAEWEVGDIWIEEEPTTCVCGHYPIIENCEIVNTKNGNTLIVGNRCVKQFMNVDNTSLFRSLHKIQKEIYASVSIKMVDFCLKKGIIRENEVAFYKNVWKKRKLSIKQMEWKMAINQKILNATKVNHFPPLPQQ